MRSSGWALIQHVWCSYKKRRRDGDTRRKPGDDGGRHWSGTPTNKEHPGLLATAETKRSSLPEPSREHGPLDADFGVEPPEL